MPKILSRLPSLMLGLAASVCWSLPARAQTVTPTTGTGDVGTSINNTGSYTITGGTQRLNTLFHSFEDFSPETANVLFQLDVSQSTVENVIGRVTGSNPSSMDGELKLTGGNSPDLFLINPNGITFGSNASLSLPGSFVASTAETVLFNGGLDFSATNPGAATLLTVSAPVGLQLGQSPGELQVQAQPGLSVNPDETLALIGGNLTFDQGGIEAPTAQVVLAGVSDGTVAMTPTWQFDYTNSQLSHDVLLTSDGGVVTSGPNGSGNVEIVGRNLTATQGGSVQTDNLSSQSGGDITVRMTGGILLARQGGRFTGFDADVARGASGAGGNITIEAPSLRLVEGGVIATGTQGDGNAGNINIIANTVFLDFDGNPRRRSLLRVQTRQGSTGNAGDINIQTNQLQAFNGATIAANTRGTGDGGNIDITANTIEFGGNASSPGAGITARVASSGTGSAGNVNIQTDQFRLYAGGLINIGTESNGNGGNLTVIANDIVVDGTETSRSSAITAEVSGRDSTGYGGNVNLQTHRLQLLNGGVISAQTEGLGDAGAINLVANGIELTGINANSGEASGIFAEVTDTAAGQGGDVNIESTSLRILKGAVIDVGTSGIGDAGSLSITAQDVDIDGGGAALQTGIFGQVRDVGTGDAGELRLQVNQLNLANGGAISAATASMGNGGDIRITADQIAAQTSASVSSETTGQGNSGNLTLLTRLLTLDTDSFLSVASSSEGKAGSLSIQSQQTTLLNGASITSQSTDLGDGGTVNVMGEALTLENGASINASTALGDGGNLTLLISEVLLLRHLSRLSAAAGGTGDGGNINIHTPIIVGLENSDITANAVAGDGGNIDITTQGIFGLKFRDQLTPENDITASSQFGVNGTVEINNLAIDPGDALVELPEAPADADNQIATACAASDGNQFIASGRGGLPVSPTALLLGIEPWIDMRALSTVASSSNAVMATDVILPGLQEAAGRTLTEANGWQVNGNGQVELLTASITASAALPSSTCLVQVNPG